MTKRVFFLLVCIFICSKFYSVDFGNNTDDITSKIKEYNGLKAAIINKPYIERMNEDDIKSFYGDKIPFDVILGNGKVTKISFIAEQMGNIGLSKKLKLGENYNTFVALFISSVVVSAATQISGFCSIFSSISGEYPDLYVNSLGTYLLPMGITLAALSVVPLVGIFVFSILMYFASPYNLSTNQARSLINQYNKFMKEKLGIPAEFDLSYNFSTNKLNMSMSIKL